MLDENFAGGTLERWGLAPKDLCRDHPRLIVASLSGFGQTGPWRDRPSYDIITQASSGFMSLTGFPGNPPTRGGGSLGDYVQGLFGAVGVLAALAARDRTGRGQAVDVSSQDGMFSLLDCWPSMHAASGRLPVQVGNAHLGTAPYDCYRASDGWVVIAVAIPANIPAKNPENPLEIAYHPGSGMRAEITEVYCPLIEYFWMSLPLYGLKD